MIQMSMAQRVFKQLQYQTLAKKICLLAKGNVCKRSGAVFTTLHFLLELRITTISLSVCPGQAIPALSDVTL